MGTKRVTNAGPATTGKKTSQATIKSVAGGQPDTAKSNGPRGKR